MGTYGGIARSRSSKELRDLARKLLFTVEYFTSKNTRYLDLDFSIVII